MLPFIQVRVTKRTGTKTETPRLAGHGRWGVAPTRWSHLIDAFVSLNVSHLMRFVNPPGGSVYRNLTIVYESLLFRQAGLQKEYV